MTQGLTDGNFRLANSLVNVLDRLFEVGRVAIFVGNGLFPVPLIDVERVRKVNIVIASQTTKVRDDSFAGFNVVVVQSPALPLG